MNFLILGDGAEEIAWAWAIDASGAHRLLAAYPGFDEFPDLARPGDLEDALAIAGVEAVVVGGRIEDRYETLRRVAAGGLPAICLHPPGDDAEAYYQVALSREETGAVVIPDLPTRLHPGFIHLKRAIDGQDPGAFRGLRIEWPAIPEQGDLARHVFPRLVDVVRALIGEVETVNATGDPPGLRPTAGLIVQLRGPEARRAEVRIESRPGAIARLTVMGPGSSLALEYAPTFDGPARLVEIGPPSSTGEDPVITDLDPWDPHAAILAVLVDAVEHRGRAVHPNLIDGTRAMELSEATVRSLRRGRTVDLHYEEISEAGTFKGAMTSIGCVLLLIVLVALPTALVGPALGIPWTIYIAYAIPPVLILFIMLQLFRFAVRKPRGAD